MDAQIEALASKLRRRCLLAMNLLYRSNLVYSDSSVGHEKQHSRRHFFCGSIFQRQSFQLWSNSSRKSRMSGENWSKRSRQVSTRLLGFATRCSRRHLAEHTVGNTVRKVLHHIREEYYTAAKLLGTTETTFSLANFVVLGQPRQQMPAAQHTRGSMSRSSSTDSGDKGLSEALRPVL